MIKIKLDLLKIKDKKLLNLLVGRDSGMTTLRILDDILEEPKNANQLSITLNLNYNTIRHHTKKLCEHNYIYRIKEGKAYYYYPDKKLYNNLNEYKHIKDYLIQKKGVKYEK